MRALFTGRSLLGLGKPLADRTNMGCALSNPVTSTLKEGGEQRAVG